MYFRILNDPAHCAFTYLLADMSSQQAVLIDPRVSDLPLLRALLSERDLRLSWVLRTHHHGASLAQETLAALGAPVVQGDVTAPGVPNAHGDVLPFGNEIIRVLATPGHTSTCLSFAWRDRLFCGDVLAVDGCPQQRRPVAPESLWDSAMQRVFTLADETLLFFGHALRARAVSTVLEQRRWHPLFASLTRDEFLTQMAQMPDGPDVD